ncbi:MAG: hypothetical protein ABUK13_06230 [Gammaproteobacteria bacterium]
MILDKFASIFSRDNRYKSLISFLFFFFLLSAVTTASALNQSNLRIEKSKPSELNDLVIRSIGGFSFDRDKQAHIDLVHTESLLQGNRLALDVGGGYVISGPISFFVGVGVSLEYSFDTSDFNDKYYAEAGATYDVTSEISVTARQLHYFHQPLNFEEVIMIGILFRH